jgi:glycosyltransferase involved in cell wall biosynthesis
VSSTAAISRSAGRVNLETIRTAHDGRASGPILFLAPDPNLPSFRYRIAPAIELLGHQGIDCRVIVFPRRRYGLRIWEMREQLREASVVVLVKFQLTQAECWLLRRHANCLALDIDDAIYVRKPREPLGAPDDTRWRRAKFAATCRAMDLVIAGNRQLAEAAQPHAPRVEIVPTPVDTARYRQSSPSAAREPRIVWIGMPENLIYLEPLRPVMQELQGRWPTLKMRIVCSRFPDWPDALLERVPWSPQSEIDALASADIGIMPLTDNEWTRGKCAFKLLQYMAAALPCVASPVGANRDVVAHESTGFLADTPDEWRGAFARLLESPQLRERMGASGLARVRQHYDVAVVSRRAAHLYAGLAGTAVAAPSA